MISVFVRSVKEEMFGLNYFLVFSFFYTFFNVISLLVIFFFSYDKYRISQMKFCNIDICVCVFV